MIISTMPVLSTIFVIVTRNHIGPSRCNCICVVTDCSTGPNNDSSDRRTEGIRVGRELAGHTAGPNRRTTHRRGLQSYQSTAANSQPQSECDDCTVSLQRGHNELSQGHGAHAFARTRHVINFTKSVNNMMGDQAINTFFRGLRGTIKTVVLVGCTVSQ
jgi:hypothetical protein